MVNFLKIITKDSIGTNVYYIKLKNIESCVLVSDNKYLINMNSGNQIQINKQFSRIEYKSKKIDWEELPEYICIE
jgi:hypothetical protein